MNITWDAGKYTEDFAFVHQYGDDIAELLDCEPGSHVVDLGCGNGALTNRIREKGFRVTGIDSSRDLLRKARETFPDIPFFQKDITSFSLEESADALFSNAVFHWIEKEKQPLLLACASKALKEGGQFVFEFGGHGNNSRIHEALEKAFSKYGYSYQMPFYFPTIGEYATLLEQEGFEVRYGVLFDRMTELKGEDGMKDWINMFLKAPFAVVENSGEREAVTDTAVENLRPALYREGKWYADYVRIRMKAYKW